MDGYYSDNEINDDKSPIEEEDGILNNDKVIHFHENFEYFTSDKNWLFFHFRYWITLKTLFLKKNHLKIPQKCH